MPKYHPYSRVEFRRRLKVWAQRNLWLIVATAVGVLITIGIIVAVLALALPASPVRWWLLGALPTAVVAAYLHLLHTAFLAHDAQAIWHVRGAWGEDNTRDELRRAKRKRLVWDWIDSVALQVGDIDHLVITRQGGLVAIDSKWRSEVADATDMAQTAHKVRLRAEALTRDLLKGDARGARRAKVNPLSVKSVVVLWGPAQHGVPPDAVVDGIEFVRGRKLVQWLAALDGQPVDRAAAGVVLKSLEERRASMTQSQQSTRR